MMVGQDFDSKYVTLGKTIRDPRVGQAVEGLPWSQVGGPTTGRHFGLVSVEGIFKVLRLEIA